MTDPNAFRQPPFQSLPAGQPGLFGKITAFIVGSLVLIAGVMFSVVALAIVAVLGLAAWGWLWWKTRALRHHIAKAQASGEPVWPQTGPATGGSNSNIIDGEVISRESSSSGDRLLR